MSRKNLNVPAVGTLAALWLSTPALAMYQLEDHIVLDDGSTMYGDPATVDQMYTEINYEMYSNCTGICSSGREYADPDPIVFANEGETADAANTTAPGGIQVDPAAGTVGPFVKTFHKDDSFGNETFGAGYAVDVSLNGTPATSSAGAKLEAVAEGKLWAKAFGSGQREVARGRASASAQLNGPVGAKLGVYVLGSQIYTKDLPVGTLNESTVFNREFFSAQKSFSILLIPVTVKAALNGNAGINVAGSVTTNVVKLTATPNGGVFASASASANIIVASIGVEGTLTLISASLPTIGQLVSTGCSTMDWGLKSDFSVNTLSGNLKAFVKIKLFFIKKKGSVTIARWSGSTQAWNLLNSTGTVPLTFTCSAGTPMGGMGALTPTGGTSTGGGDGGGGGGGGYGGGGCLTAPQDGSSESIIMIEACQ